jgi:HTH-type transcriptional regulator/antitoxin HigA
LHGHSEEQQGTGKKAVIGVIGSRVGVYEVLRRDPALSLGMSRRLNQRLNIPAEVLIRPIRRRKTTLVNASRKLAAQR